MRRHCRSFLLMTFALLTALHVAHHEAGAQAVAAAAGQDVDSLRAWIDRIHPHPYRIHTRQAFDSVAAELRARIDRAPEHVAALELQRMLAMVGDGHTELATLPPSLRGPGLPLILRRLVDGWFVVTGHFAHAALFGRPIVSIGGVPVEELAGRLGAYVAADNAIGRLDGIGNWMRNAHALEAVGLDAAVGRALPFVIVEDDRSQRTVPVEVLAEVRFGDDWFDAEKFLDSTVPEALFRTVDGNYACRFLPDERAVYVWYGEVRDDDDVGPIDDFFPRVLDFAERSSAERLVLDIRENQGGNLDLNGPVIRGILRSRFDRPGALFVVIGRDTYSAAMHLAVTLERLGHPLFVGEPTGSRPNHWGDTRELTLPGTGVRVEISELYWQQSDPRDARPWITPDLAAAPSMAERLVGRDAALEAALGFRATPSFADAFGPPLSRWQRDGQRVDERWPALLEPAGGPLRPIARSPAHGPALSCEG